MDTDIVRMLSVNSIMRRLCLQTAHHAAALKLVTGLSLQADNLCSDLWIVFVQKRQDFEKMTNYTFEN